MLLKIGSIYSELSFQIPEPFAARIRQGMNDIIKGKEDEARFNLTLLGAHTRV